MSSGIQNNTSGFKIGGLKWGLKSVTSSCTEWGYTVEVLTISLSRSVSEVEVG